VALTQDEMSQMMQRVFAECQGLRDAGQKEYAHAVENAFGNFERIGKYLQLDRERVLLVYALKHFDGITAWVNGHRSQREGVRGRINDAIVYLCLLRGMIEDLEGKKPWVEGPSCLPGVVTIMPCGS